MYDKYREQMAAKLKSMITDDHQRILCVGDELQQVAEAVEADNKEWVFLDPVNVNWKNLGRDQPHLELDLPEKHFDLLLVYHGLEQALDPERLLLYLRKYVQPEGQCFLVAYNVGHLSTVVNLLTEGWSYKDDGALRHEHIRYYSNTSLRYLMEQVGFEFVNEVVYQMVQMPALTKQLSQMMNNPYLGILSFIMVGRKINRFPFIDFEDDVDKTTPPPRVPESNS